jgi:hypothetical protein
MKGKSVAIKNYDLDTPVLFRCTTCGFEELIPKNVVDYFDVMDGGDPTFPPRFDCQGCAEGKMQPVHYVNHDGIVYSL